MLVSANLSKLYDESIADFFYGKPAGKHIAKEIKKDRLNIRISTKGKHDANQRNKISTPQGLHGNNDLQTLQPRAKT